MAVSPKVLNTNMDALRFFASTVQCQQKQNQPHAKLATPIVPNANKRRLKNAGVE
jgi:hypothetical protein